MNHLTKLTCLVFTVAAGLAATITSGRAQGAVATISGVQVGGVFDYTIILQNTGSGNLNSFWYGWTASGNNLPTPPSSPLNSLGWGNTLFGNSIMWVSSSGSALAPGQFGTFTFVSSSTPAQITTAPAGGSVVYVNGITFTQNNPGDSSPVFSPTLVTAPEPSTLALWTTGWLLLAGLFRKTGASRRVFQTKKINPG
jgi:hypothetical protein